MEWDTISKDYDERKEREKELGIQQVREKFEELVGKMNSEDFDNFEEGILPSAVTNLVDIDPLTGNFVSKDYPDITIATIYDIFDAKERRLNALVNNDELNTCDYGS